MDLQYWNFLSSPNESKIGSNDRYWWECFRSKTYTYRSSFFYRCLFTFWKFILQMSAICFALSSVCLHLFWFISCLYTLFQPLCFLMSSFDKLQKMKSFNVNLTENEAELWSRIFLIASTHFFLTTFLLSLWKNSFFHYWYCNAATLWCRNDITSMGIF